jgi:mannosyltransferase OCH1-like enzyme
MIPKTIHYCWLSGDTVPETFQAYMKTWREKLPGYEFVLWNFDRFDINSSLWVKQAFAAKKYAFAADVIRLFAVYHYGGIYLDMDVEIIRSFDDLLERNIMIAYENNKNKTIEAGCFGAEKGHPFVKSCYDYFSGREFSQKVIDDGYTLPRVMKKIHTGNVEFRGLPVYPEDYFTAKKFRTGIIKTTKNTYAVHHFEGSWFSEQDRANHAVAEKISALFGDNIFSVFIILCAAFGNRIKKYGLLKTIRYYLKQFHK